MDLRERMKRIATGTLLLVPVITVGALLAQLPDPPGAAADRPSMGLFAPDRWPGMITDAADVVLTIPSVSGLEAAFRRLDYRWEDLGTAVPRVRVNTLPEDLGEVTPLSARKRLFYQSVLPIVLMENERVAKQRTWLLRILDRDAHGLPVTAYETAWLEALANRSDVDDPPLSPAGREALTLRVAPIPPSLALAMAALESGWGTSRFAAVGNNLFGHWTFRPGTGLIPHRRPAGARYEVAVFPDLSSAFRAYLHNLNTHWAYADFRARRAELGDLNAPGAGVTLAESLVRYSTRGTDYTADVVHLIRRNNLTRFDGATLGTPVRTEAARADDGSAAVS
jgi:Bax protein